MPKPANALSDFEAELLCLREEVTRLRALVAQANRHPPGTREQAGGSEAAASGRQRVESALQRVEERSAVVTRVTGMGTWEIDVGTHVPVWDAQMYRLRGLAPDDPRPVDDIIAAVTPPGDRPLSAEKLVSAAIAGVPYANEFRVVLPDGSIRWLASRGMIVGPSEEGGSVRMFGVNWDVTENKRNEQALRDKAAAEQANLAKSEFLARMSHELRTPLNAVLGFSDLMLGDRAAPLDPSQRARAEHVQRAGLHLLALVDEVLDLTGIEAGRLPLADEPVAIDSVLADVLRWLAPQAQAAAISLERGLIGRRVRGDAKRWRQVFSNLLSNAVKYNLHGGSVVVSVAAPEACTETMPEGEDDWVVVSVRDSGPGLSAPQVRQLFEPFNRLGAERGAIEGTGIGLSIVKLLAERMGGRIGVKSTPGQGSDFRVWMRAAPDEAAPAVPGAAADALAGAAGVPSEARLEVVYIEDNPVNMLLVGELLALRPRVAMHPAVNGLEGVAMSARLKPQVVLVDMQLPDIDGFEVLRRLRAEPALQAARCIALSANAMPEDVAHAREAGFDDYWTKPIDARRFLADMDRLIAALA